MARTEQKTKHTPGNPIPLSELMALAREVVCKVPLCHWCGLPQSKNPHPRAGNYEDFLEVGTQWACIPCLTWNRHRWSQRAWAAEGELRDALNALKDLVQADTDQADPGLQYLALEKARTVLSRIEGKG